MNARGVTPIKKLVLKDMTGKTKQEVEITRFPEDWNGKIEYDEIYDKVISILEDKWDALDFSTDGEEEVLGWDSYKPNKKLWLELRKGLEGLGFQFKE